MKLVKMESRLGDRVIGRRMRFVPSPTPSGGRGPACRTPTVPWDHSFSWVPPAWVRRNSPEPWRSFSSMMIAR